MPAPQTRLPTFPAVLLPVFMYGSLYGFSDAAIGHHSVFPCAAMQRNGLFNEFAPALLPAFDKIAILAKTLRIVRLPATLLDPPRAADV